LDPQAHPDLLDLQVLRDHRGLLVLLLVYRLGLLDMKEPPALVDRREGMDLRDLLDLRESLDLPDLRVLVIQPLAN
jgi:hypothetical protein